MLHNSYQEMRERYIFIKIMKKIYLKDNKSMYRMIRLQRLQMKDANPNPSTHLTLETLAEATVSIQPPKASQVVVKPPNIELVDEES